RRLVAAVHRLQHGLPRGLQVGLHPVFPSTEGDAEQATVQDGEQGQEQVDADGLQVLRGGNSVDFGVFGESSLAQNSQQQALLSVLTAKTGVSKLRFSLNIDLSSTFGIPMPQVLRLLLVPALGALLSLPAAAEETPARKQ